MVLRDKIPAQEMSLVEAQLHKCSVLQMQHKHWLVPSHSCTPFMRQENNIIHYGHLNMYLLNFLVVHSFRR